MLLEEQIRQALHASRVVPLSVENPHGPLGLEQLAAAVSRINPVVGVAGQRVQRPVSLDCKTWEKLNRLAENTAQATSQPVTASQIAAVIIEEYIATLPQQDATRE